MKTRKNYSITLCLLCQNACGKCAWSKWLEPVDGWEAVVEYKKNGKVNHAWVGWCPKFVADRGLYDIMTGKDEEEGRQYVISQYGYLTRLRYAAIRYRMLNSYERTAKDENRANNINSKAALRQSHEAFKGKVQHAVK